MLDKRSSTPKEPAAPHTEADSGKSGADVETCHHLQEHLLGFADPKRNHGVNALMDYMQTSQEYDAKCVSLGFPSSRELLDAHKKH